MNHNDFSVFSRLDEGKVSASEVNAIDEVETAGVRRKKKVYLA